MHLRSAIPVLAATLLIPAHAFAASWVVPSSVRSVCETAVARSEGLFFRDCSFAGDPRSPDDSARVFLDDRAAALGLDDGSSELELIEEELGLGTGHARFRQRAFGLPVFGSEVVVNFKPDGEVGSVHSTYRSGLLHGGATQPSLSAQAAEAIGLEAAAKQGSASVPASLRHPVVAELVWFPLGDRQVRLAWKLMLYTDEPLGDWLTLIDANSGGVLLQENRIAYATGSGYTYVPNPYQTQGSGTGINDNNDANSTTLATERVSVTLLGLDEGTGLLRGEFVDLSTLNSTSLPDVDADEAGRTYFYDRDDPRFEQVTIYHSIDSIQRYFHSLGFDDDAGAANGIRDFPTLANAHWGGADNSFYSTVDDALHFGDGGVDDGEDADKVAHEYGHAVQHDQNASWGSGEMGAMGEGFGDYLAMSFHHDVGDPTYQAAHNACVAEWDATSYAFGTPPCMRRTDGNKIYPDDLSGQDHADGEIWSRALWDIRNALGGPTTDRIVLEHHFSLAGGATMPIAALEMVAADGALNAGANEIVLRQTFCDRGILSMDQCLPALAAPTLIYPVGGESLAAGSVVDIRWSTNGAPGDATYQVDYGAGCTAAPVFSDDVEGVPMWTASHDAGSSDWNVVSDNPHSFNSAWFAADGAAVSDQLLTQTTAVELTGPATLSFWHQYVTESTYDGGVVEISTDGSTWIDLGPAMTQNGYNSTMNNGSPIAGREAFSGSIGGYVETLADLSAYAGETVQIRFRMATDGSVSATGWWVDDIGIFEAPDWQAIGTSAPGATSLAWTLPVVTGDDYCVRLHGSAAGFGDSPVVTGDPFAVVDDPVIGFHNSGDKNELSWIAPVGVTGYEVARSVDPEFSAGCTITMTVDTFWSDAAPPPGVGFYYLVRVLTPIEGSWGQSSAGERTIVCP